MKKIKIIECIKYAVHIGDGWHIPATLIQIMDKGDHQKEIKIPMLEKTGKDFKSHFIPDIRAIRKEFEKYNNPDTEFIGIGLISITPVLVDQEGKGMYAGMKMPKIPKNKSDILIEIHDYQEYEQFLIQKYTIYPQKVYSVEQLCEETGLSSPWIRKIQNELIQEGVAQKVGKILVITDLKGAMVFLKNRPDNRGRKPKNKS